MAAAAMEVLLQERPKGIVSHTIVGPEMHARSRTFRRSESHFLNIPLVKVNVPSTDCFWETCVFVTHSDCVCTFSKSELPDVKSHGRTSFSYLFSAASI